MKSKKKFIETSIDQIENDFLKIQLTPVLYLQKRLRLMFGNEFKMSEFELKHALELYSVEDWNCQCIIPFLEEYELYEKCQLIMDYLNLYKIAIEEVSLSLWNVEIGDELQTIHLTNKENVLSEIERLKKEENVREED